MNVMRYGEAELSTVPFENYEVLGRVEVVASVEMFVQVKSSFSKETQESTAV